MTVSMETDSLETLPAAGTIEKIEANLASVIRGKPGAIRLLLIALLAGGHTLLEDVPGTGKTTLAKSLARSMDGLFRRIQFTPDLLPADITGSSFLQSWRRFVYVPRRAGVCEYRAGRRNQPNFAAHPVCAAGSDERRAGHDRRPAARPAPAVLCGGNAKPDRFSRDVSPARSPARPLCCSYYAWLPRHVA